MRIFIALLFETITKDIISDIALEVKNISSSGNFTTYNNLHLTLLYLGETSEADLKIISKKLNEIEFTSFEYETKDIKYFKKSSSQVVAYLSVEKSDNLQSLYHQIRLKLKEIGIDFDSIKYTPHITLGRKVIVKKDCSLEDIYCNKLILKANRISVMESKRVNNKLVYEEIFNVPLSIE